MKARSTIEELRSLIKGTPAERLNPHLFEGEIVKEKKRGNPKKGQKYKDWIKLHLMHFCNAKGWTLEDEYRFDPDRKWQFDHAIPERLIAVEYEGLMSEKSGHSTIGGYTANTEKYNAASSQGWTLYRYTALNYKNLLKDMELF